MWRIIPTGARSDAARRWGGCRAHAAQRLKSARRWPGLTSARA